MSSSRPKKCRWAHAVNDMIAESSSRNHRAQQKKNVLQADQTRRTSKTVVSSTTQLPSSILTHLRCASSASACARGSSPVRSGIRAENTSRKREQRNPAVCRESRLRRGHPQEVLPHRLVRDQPARGARGSALDTRRRQRTPPVMAHGRHCAAHCLTARGALR